MKMYFVYSVAAILLFSACKKLDHSTLLTARDFPTTIGSWWKYQQLNEDNTVSDTVTFIILDLKAINGVIFQRWVETQTAGPNAAYPDTSYVLVTDSNIGFYSNDPYDYPYPAMNINFPVLDNETWCTINPGSDGLSYNTGIKNITIANVPFHLWLVL